MVIDDLGLVPPSGNPGSTGDGASLANITGDGGTGNRTGTPQGCAAGTGLTEGPYPIGMAPNQVLDAYGIDDLQAAGFRGEGTRVAIVDDSIYEPAWLDGYRACFGLADATPVTPHVIGTPSTSESGETILDLSVMSAVAPKVDRFDVFMVDSTINPAVIDHAGSMITMFGAPLDASQTGGQAPDVISASFGLCEALDMYWAGKTAAVAIMEDVLATAAAAGISYLVSTGDSGSSGCQASFKSTTPVTDPAVTVLSAQYPATSAWVTAVGGTNLTLDAANEIVSSGVWNDQAYGTATIYDAGVGGTSTLIDRPWYQQGSGVPAGSQRVVPDISAFADVLPGYALLGPSPAPAPTPDPGQWQFVGGTSAAAPLMAGSTLLLDQQAEQRGQPPLGFLNPLLYELGRAGSASILDITLGNDDVFDVGCCSAAAGFDLATGWGSPLVDRLAATLAAPTVQVLPARSAAGATVTVTAQVGVPGGSVTAHAWDTNGDGITDQVTATPQVTFATPTAGLAPVTVSVLTTLGRTATASGTVLVTRAPARLSFTG